MTGRISDDDAVLLTDWTEYWPIVKGGLNKRLLASNIMTAATWTPVVTFAVPGDLAVAYSVQVGEAYRIGNWVDLMFRITTSTFTFTTASGNLMITGSPYTAKTITNGSWAGTLAGYRGITKANFTQFNPVMDSASNQISVVCSGSAQVIASLAATDMPTGGTVILRGRVGFPIA